MKELENFMKDFERFQKKYWKPIKSNEYWDSMLTDSKSLVCKYHGNQYFQNLVILFMTTKEEEAMNHAA